MWRPHAMVIHHVVFELGKTRGGAGLVLAYVHSSESFGTAQQTVVETTEDVTLAANQQQVLVVTLYIEIRVYITNFWQCNFKQ